jgi:hypothetical protein
VVIFSQVVTDWLDQADDDTYDLFQAAVRVLHEEGPALGRPLVDRIHGARHHNMKELRPGSTGRSEVRALFVFDPARRAIVLVVGDKSGQWDTWYATAIPQADAICERYLEGRTI